jgi:hypothetical protein
MEAQEALCASPPAVPTDALVFKFPSGLAWVVLGGAFLFLGFMIFVLALPLIEPSQASLAVELLGVTVSGSFATMCLRSFRRLRDSVAANSHGIWYLPRKGESTFIAWSDVASVNARDTQQRLVLTDATGSRSIRLEYQLEDFSRLRDLVLRNTASTRLHSTAATDFHRTWINKGVFLCGTMLFIVFAWLSRAQGQPGPSFFFMGFAALSLVGIMRDPLRVLITSQAVVVKYPGWERTIPFADIGNITLAEVRNRGNVWAVVVIERRRGKPIKLFRFREGSVALHESLQSAWRSAGGDLESNHPK